MAGSGSIDLRVSARITNLPDPISGREPALARDSTYRPVVGGRVLTNEVNLAALTTVAISANVARFTLLEVDSDINISTTTTEPTAVIANGYRTCIYKTNDSYYPTTLVADGGVDQSASAVGIKTSSIGGNKILRAGVYVVGIKSSSAMTMRAVAQASCSKLLGRQNISAYPAITGYTVPLTWVANTPWPTTFPALTVTNLTNVAQVLHALISV